MNTTPKSFESYSTNLPQSQSLKNNDLNMSSQNSK